MSFMPSGLPRAGRALLSTVNSFAQYRCFYFPSHRPPIEHKKNKNYQLLQSRRAFHASLASQATKNPYTVLGVDKSASSSEIKRAYYQAAKKFHPDTSKEPNAREKFQEISAAWEILSNPLKKEQFDQFGDVGIDPSSAGGFQPGGAGAGFSGFGGSFGAEFSFEDIFSAFGGAAGGGHRAGRGRSPFTAQTVVGEDIQAQVTIGFLDAAKGTVKEIRTQPLTNCNICTGTGMKKGTNKKECGRCGGTGTRVSFMAGGFQMAHTCESCDGNGVTIPPGSECRSCDGKGTTREIQNVMLEIPAGIEDGMRIRVSGEGDTPFSSFVGSGQKKKRGDLHVYIHVAPHTQFGRKGSDILYTASIPMTTALLGGIIKVPTLDGEVELRVPTGTSTGDKISMSGMGMRKLNSHRATGDLKVEFKLHMPKSLTSSQRTLLELLADEFKDHTAKRIMNVGQFAKEAAQKKVGKDCSCQDPLSPSSGNHSKADGGILKILWDKLTQQKDTDATSTSTPLNQGRSSQKASGSS